MIQILFRRYDDEYYWFYIADLWMDIESLAKKSDKFGDGYTCITEHSFQGPAVDLAVHDDDDRPASLVVSILGVAASLVNETKSSVFQCRADFFS